MDEITAIAAITPPSLISLLFSAVLFLRWISKQNIRTLYFAAAFLFMGLCFDMWVIRTLLYPRQLNCPGLTSGLDSATSSA